MFSFFGKSKKSTDEAPQNHQDPAALPTTGPAPSAEGVTNPTISPLQVVQAEAAAVAPTPIPNKRPFGNLSLGPTSLRPLKAKGPVKTEPSDTSVLSGRSSREPSFASASEAESIGSERAASDYPATRGGGGATSLTPPPQTQQPVDQKAAARQHHHPMVAWSTAFNALSATVAAVASPLAPVPKGGDGSSGGYGGSSHQSTPTAMPLSSQSAQPYAKSKSGSTLSDSGRNVPKGPGVGPGPHSRTLSSSSPLNAQQPPHPQLSESMDEAGQPQSTAASTSRPPPPQSPSSWAEMESSRVCAECFLTFKRCVCGTCYLCLGRLTVGLRHHCRCCWMPCCDKCRSRVRLAKPLTGHCYPEAVKTGEERKKKHDATVAAVASAAKGVTQPAVVLATTAPVEVPASVSVPLVNLPTNRNGTAGGGVAEECAKTIVVEEGHEAATQVAVSAAADEAATDRESPFEDEAALLPMSARGTRVRRHLARLLSGTALPAPAPITDWRDNVTQGKFCDKCAPLSALAFIASPPPPVALTSDNTTTTITSPSSPASSASPRIAGGALYSPYRHVGLELLFTVADLPRRCVSFTCGATTYHACCQRCKCPTVQITPHAERTVRVQYCCRFSPCELCTLKERKTRESDDFYKRLQADRHAHMTEADVEAAFRPLTATAILDEWSGTITDVVLQTPESDEDEEGKAQKAEKVAAGDVDSGHRLQEAPPMQLDAEGPPIECNNNTNARDGNTKTARETDDEQRARVIFCRRVLAASLCASVSYEYPHAPHTTLEHSDAPFRTTLQLLGAHRQYSLFLGPHKTLFVAMPGTHDFRTALMDVRFGREVVTEYSTLHDGIRLSVGGNEEGVDGAQATSTRKKWSINDGDDDEYDFYYGARTNTEEPLPAEAKPPRATTVGAGGAMKLWEYKVHKGFLDEEQALQNLLPTAFCRDYVRRGYFIVFCGHSLGGALATMMTLRHLREDLETFQGRILCVTFGAPFVGSSQLTRRVQRCGWGRYFHHYVYRSDIVTRLMCGRHLHKEAFLKVRATTTTVVNKVKDMWASLWGSGGGGKDKEKAPSGQATPVTKPLADPQRKLSSVLSSDGEDSASGTPSLLLSPASRPLSPPLSLPPPFASIATAATSTVTRTNANANPKRSTDKASQPLSSEAFSPHSLQSCSTFATQQAAEVADLEALEADIELSDDNASPSVAMFGGAPSSEECLRIRSSDEHGELEAGADASLSPIGGDAIGLSSLIRGDKRPYDALGRYHFLQRGVPFRTTDVPSEAFAVLKSHHGLRMNVEDHLLSSYNRGLAVLTRKPWVLNE